MYIIKNVTTGKYYWCGMFHEGAHKAEHLTKPEAVENLEILRKRETFNNDGSVFAAFEVVYNEVVL